MKPEDLIVSALNFSEYSKGATFSASDLTSQPLRVKLKMKYPNHDDVKTNEKVAAWIGTGCHLLLERFINAENDFGKTNMRTEVKVKFRNLSGTIDVLFDDGTIADLKTGGESTIKKKLSKPDDWKLQLSIYSYLNWKQNKVPMQPIGYIYWITTDTKKYGTAKIELYTLEEITNIVKEFMVEMKVPIEETAKCKDCSWLWKWCSSRSKCSYYVDDDMTNIDEW